MKWSIFIIIIGWGLCQDTLWTRRYDGGLDEAGYSVAIDNNENIIIAGVKIDIAGGTIPGNCLVVKYNSDGNLLWAKEYDAGGDDWIIDVAVDTQNNIIAVGYTEDTINYYDQALIIKFSPSGDTIWSQRYLYSGYEYGLGVGTDTQNNIYVSGYSSDGISCNVLLLKYSPDGNLIWSDMYDFGDFEIGYRNVVNNNGNIYLCGIYYPPSWMGDFLILKCAPDGDTLWSRIYDFGQDDGGCDIALDLWGDIVLTGFTGGGPYDVLTVKCNTNGDTLWARTFDYGGDDGAFGIATNSLGDIFVSGFSEGNMYDYLTLRYTPSGNLKWTGRFDTGSDDQGLGVAVDGSNNIITSGASYNGNNYDFLIVKYRPDVGVSEYSKSRVFIPQIFPNPTSDKIYLQTLEYGDKIEAKIYDVCGRIVRSMEFDGSTPLIEISLTGLTPGTYFLEAKIKEKSFINKFIVAR